MACQTTNHQLPSQRYKQLSLDSGYEISGDTLIINLQNPVHAPMRYKISTDDPNLKRLIPTNWIQLKSLEDSTIVLRDSAFAKANTSQIQMSILFGDPNVEVRPHPIHLPTALNKPVAMMQVYNGNFSHFKTNSRYALDFTMAEGDTVYAADAGRVIGVIKDYERGGNDVKWTDFANFITIYNNKANWFTQYVHLKKNGAFVKIGDSIVPGQPIGLSGKTGYTSKEHLHFNVFKTTNEGNGIISMPVTFFYVGKGADLKQGEMVTRSSAQNSASK
ncbi:M23 family metallopeptidase [Nonlabens sp. Hel1_33_55]|uniref:M23 family metallopeptidase n=1 Tax=Nonlabens sp. Hel1_33_55 TaxID=1336802 RepID=UPI0012FD94C0|nr:M23 family metallopeptidase [Nonlabens sp. Hel1_33_55]